MLAFGIRYLNGFAAAAAPDSHDVPEWPPHPGRVFLAMAAAHFETGGDASEREALQVLEGLPDAPRIRAGEHVPRALVTHFVPVNDKAGDRSKPPTAIVQSSPQIARDRQPRTFARAWLEDDSVFLWWPDVDPPPALRAALAALCAKVTRIGHSTSFVQMWLAGDAEVGEATWVPDDVCATVQLRIAAPGTLEDLERRFAAEATDEFARLEVAAADDTDKKAQRAARAKLKADFPDGPPVRLRPELPLSRGYARPSPDRDAPAAPGTVFSPHLTVLTLEPEAGHFRHLDLLCVLPVVQRWREAILSQSNDLPDSVRSLLSGHDASGAPLDGPHLAFVPMAFVGHEHADGRLLGMGLAFPESVPAGDRHDALRAIARVRRLVLGRLGVWKVGHVVDARPLANLRPETWTAHPDGATQWATVTPVVYDRHPKGGDRAAYEREVAAMITQACVRVGLPEPKRVVVTPVSAHLGVPPAHAFPRLRRKDGSERRHVHAVVVFEKAVRGPVVIGAGRYRGYGTCRPAE
jgi:CRISPR-associated protein Csb2